MERFTSKKEESPGTKGRGQSGCMGRGPRKRLTQTQKPHVWFKEPLLISLLLNLVLQRLRNREPSQPRVSL